MKCIVTGGAGFIGSNFIIYLLNKCPEKAKVVNIDSLTYAGNLDNLRQVENREGYTFIKTNICDRTAVFRVFEENQADYVFHFAAESHVDRSIKNPSVFAETNFIGTVNLLDAAKKRGAKFIQISTDEVYGSLPEVGLFTEETPLNPRSPYSASKAAADMMALSYYSTYGMPVCVTRCSNNYGPRQFPEKLIPLMINNARKGEKLPVYGDGGNVRDWLYVTDHAAAILSVAFKGEPGQVYNIGGNNEKRNIDLVRLLIRELRRALPKDARSHVNEGLIEFVKDRPGHDRRYAIDASKAFREIGWKPETSFEDGIRKTIKWYLDNDEWTKKVVSGEYADFYKKMYVLGERL